VANSIIVKCYRFMHLLSVVVVYLEFDYVSLKKSIVKFNYLRVLLVKGRVSKNIKYMICEYSSKRKEVSKCTP